jgi:hypothetical protein
MLNTLQSARYYTVLAGCDVNGDGFSFSDRAGDIGRNTYRGDPSYTTDVRVQRIFALGERFKVEASAEIFDLLNRQNVNAVDTVDGPQLSSDRSRKDSETASAVPPIRRLVHPVLWHRPGKFSSPYD